MNQDEVDDIYIDSIEMDLRELLFEEVMHRAFLEALAQRIPLPIQNTNS